MSVQIENMVKNLHLLVLPSTLWGVHIDPKQKFIAVLHVNTTSSSKVAIDKGVLLTCENDSLKASVSLNDEIVELPTTMSRVEVISDLSSLLYSLHDIKFCMRCSKCIFNSAASEYCEYCAIEEFELKEQQGSYPANDSDSLNNFNIEIEQPLVQRDYICNSCGDNFHSEDLLEKHLLLHSAQNEKSHLCTVCGKTFSTMYAMEDHMLIHSDDKPFKCKVCLKSFAKKYNLNVHIRVHSGERPYVCSKCGKTFSTRSNLSTHMNSAHCEEKKHPCEFCSMTFVHPRVLRIHMRKHTGEKPFMCQICGKVFSKNIHLTIHTRTHTGEKPFACDLCGKAFTTTGNLNSHKKINHKNVIAN